VFNKGFLYMTLHCSVHHGRNVRKYPNAAVPSKPMIHKFVATFCATRSGHENKTKKKKKTYHDGKSLDKKSAHLDTSRKNSMRRVALQRGVPKLAAYTAT
jgi:hypothetical protein